MSSSGDWWDLFLSLSEATSSIWPIFRKSSTGLSLEKQIAKKEVAVTSIKILYAVLAGDTRWADAALDGAWEAEEAPVEFTPLSNFDLVEDFPLEQSCDDTLHSAQP